MKRPLPNFVIGAAVPPARERGPEMIAPKIAEPRGMLAKLDIQQQRAKKKVDPNAGRFSADGMPR
eukprot:11573948-Alexandrium_andersonii.AAC.1